MLSEIAKELIQLAEVKAELEPIETAVNRAKAEYDKLAQEVLTLSEEAESLKGANDKANQIIADAQKKEIAAQVILDEADRKAQQQIDDAQRKATKILADARANKDDFGRQAEDAMLRLRNLNSEIEMARQDLDRLNSEIGPLKSEVETLRHQRAAYLRQEMGV